MEKNKAGKGVRSIVLNRVVRENSMRRKLLSKDLDIQFALFPLVVFHSSQLTTDWKQRLEMSTL